MIGALLAATIFNGFPIARGSSINIATAYQAALNCKTEAVSVTHIGNARAVLMLDGKSTNAQVDCIMGWIKKHRRQMHFEQIGHLNGRIGSKVYDEAW